MSRNEIKINVKTSMKETIITILIAAAIIGVWLYEAPETDNSSLSEQTQSEYAGNFDNDGNDEGTPIQINFAGQSGELYGPFEVVRVVDGDTVKLNIGGNVETVRLIGIDTPESVHPNKEKNVPEGKLASDHTKELLDGKNVYIEYGEDPTDHYDRVLAYLYFDENTMINAELLKDGYAKVYTVNPNNKYKDYFLAVESEAKNSGAGLWDTGVFDKK